jgi:hypothetical protein
VSINCRVVVDPVAHRGCNIVELFFIVDAYTTIPVATWASLKTEVAIGDTIDDINSEWIWAIVGGIEHSEVVVLNRTINSNVVGQEFFKHNDASVIFGFSNEDMLTSVVSDISETILTSVFSMYQLVALLIKFRH